MGGFCNGFALPRGGSVINVDTPGLKLGYGYEVEIRGPMN